MESVAILFQPEFHQKNSNPFEVIFLKLLYFFILYLTTHH